MHAFQPLLIAPGLVNGEPALKVLPPLLSAHLELKLHGARELAAVRHVVRVERIELTAHAHGLALLYLALELNCVRGLGSLVQGCAAAGSS